MKSIAQKIPRSVTRWSLSIGFFSPTSCPLPHYLSDLSPITFHLNRSAYVPSAYIHCHFSKTDTFCLRVLVHVALLPGVSSRRYLLLYFLQVCTQMSPTRWGHFAHLSKITTYLPPSLLYFSPSNKLYLTFNIFNVLPNFKIFLEALFFFFFFKQNTE